MSAELSRRPHTLYYHHDGVQVTSRYFANGTARYELNELTNPARSHGSQHPGVMVGLVTAAAELAIVVPLVALLRSPIAFALAVPALLIPCLASYFCARRWPTQLELLADYRGRQVTLFVTRDSHQFGQVTRALSRALETGHQT